MSQSDTSPPPRAFCHLFILFGIIFALFPIGLIIDLWSQPPDSNSEHPLKTSLFLSIFLFIGVGIVVTGVRGLLALKRQTKLAVTYKDEPWMTNPEWAKGKIKDGNIQQTIVLGFMALIWSSVSCAAFWNILHDDSADQAARFAILIFLLIGIGLLVVFVYNALRWYRFGTSVFELTEVPGVIGGTLGGIIRTRVRLRPINGFQLTLQCINRVVSGSGKNRSIKETILWEQQTNILSDTLPQAARGTLIPVLMDIPYTCEPTQATSPRANIYWKLTVSAQLPGVDYNARFHVPVYKTADSRPDHTATKASSTDPSTTPPITELQPSGKNSYRFEETPAGITFCFYGARHALLTVMAMVYGFAIICFAVIAATKIPWVFVVLAGLIGSWIELYALSMLIKRTLVDANATGITVTQRRLFSSNRIHIPSSQIKAITFREGVTINNVTLYHIHIERIDTPPLKLATYIKGQSMARAIIAKLNQHAQIKPQD